MQVFAMNHNHASDLRTKHFPRHCTCLICWSVHREDITVVVAEPTRTLRKLNELDQLLVALQKVRLVNLLELEAFANFLTDSGTVIPSISTMIVFSDCTRRCTRGVPQEKTWKGQVLS